MTEFDADRFNPHDESSDPEYDSGQLRYEIDVAKFKLGCLEFRLKTAQADFASGQTGDKHLPYRIRILTGEVNESASRLEMLKSKLAIFLTNYPECA